MGRAIPRARPSERVEPRPGTTPIDTVTEAASPRTARPVTARVRSAGLDLWYPVVVVFVVGVLSAFAISGSSLAALEPSGSPGSSAVIAGHVRPIRSDEYIAISPI